jgi:aspartate/methionine/tyrosine aminotransferase
MFSLSEMMRKIQGSERSQLQITSPPNAIRLNRGEPDFPTPDHIQEAAYRAMKNNFTHSGSSYGDEELREAICFGLRRDYGVQRTRDNVLITCGGIAGINTIAATYLNPGDEVLIPDPGHSA